MVSIDHEIVTYLVQRAKEGDREAFSKIVRLMMKDIVALTYRMTQNRESAQDLAQETFISAWENLPDFRGDAAFTSWLYRIAANKTLNFLKQRARHREMSLDTTSELTMESEAGYDNPEQSLKQKELHRAILGFMSGLPVQQRLVFDLHFYKKLTFDQIAQITGKAVGTVKTHYREAIIKLRAFAQQTGWQP